MEKLCERICDCFPPTVPPEVLITVDLLDTINEKLIFIQRQKKAGHSSKAVINFAISPVLDVVLTTY